jgi:hypothetical protein
MKLMQRKLIIIISLLFLLSSFTIEAQCAMCRAVLESGENQETARGVNNGIMYLMVFPYLLIGVIGFAIYRSRKKTK